MITQLVRPVEKVKESVLSWTTKYTVYENGSSVGHGQMSAFSWGVEIKYYDCDGNYIGRIKEDVVKGAFSWKTTYYLYDAGGNKLAESKKLDYLGTEIILYTPAGEKICKNSPSKSLVHLGIRQMAN